MHGAKSPAVPHNREVLPRLTGCLWPPGCEIVGLDILPRLKAWDWRVPMSGCLGAHHSTAVSRGLLRLRRPTLSLAGATPAMPAASLVTFPDAGRCPDLGISPGDSVVAVTVAGVADKSRRACPPAEARGLRATFLLVMSASLSLADLCVDVRAGQIGAQEPWRPLQTQM